MKNLIIPLAAACAMVGGYLGVRHFTRRDLGFTPARTVQVSAAFASILAITHVAGVVFEAVAVLGLFAVDLLTGQVVARMDERERIKLAKAA
jgi:hypothetical protein